MVIYLWINLVSKDTVWNFKKTCKKIWKQTNFNGQSLESFKIFLRRITKDRPVWRLQEANLLLFLLLFFYRDASFNLWDYNRKNISNLTIIDLVFLRTLVTWTLAPYSNDDRLNPTARNWIPTKCWVRERAK